MGPEIFTGVPYKGVRRWGIWDLSHRTWARYPDGIINFDNPGLAAAECLSFGTGYEVREF